MMSALIAAFAATASPAVSNAATAPLAGQWASLTIEPAFGGRRTEIVFGTLGSDRTAHQLDYWIRREERRRDGVTVRWADSRTCPALRAIIADMRSLGTLQPDPPGFADDIIATADGVLYTLEVPARYAGGHIGTLRISANGETPLAAWAASAERRIADCWSEYRPAR